MAAPRPLSDSERQELKLILEAIYNPPNYRDEHQGNLTPAEKEKITKSGDIDFFFDGGYSGRRTDNDDPKDIITEIIYMFYNNSHVVEWYNENGASVTLGTGWRASSTYAELRKLAGIEGTGCAGEGPPLTGRYFRSSPHVWLTAMREAARLRGHDGQDPATDDYLLDSLFALLESSESRAQDWAIRGIQYIGSTALPRLVNTVTGKNPVLSSVAARALIGMGQTAVPILMSAFATCVDSAREPIVQVLSQMKHQPPLVQTIVELAALGYERDFMMSEARGILEGQTNSDSFVRQLTAAVRQSDPRVCKKALLAMYQLGPKAHSAIPAIQELLDRESNALTRRMANNALASIGVENRA
jgi:hypothetical protein